MFAISMCLILTIMILSGTSFFRPTNPSQTLKTWHEVRKFTGLEDEITSVFHVSGENWRILWYFETDYPESVIFGFLVYPEGETEDYIFVCKITSSDLETGFDGYSDFDAGYEYLAGSGNYYINIISGNADWMITVESYH